MDTLRDYEEFEYNNQQVMQTPTPIHRPYVEEEKFMHDMLFDDKMIAK
jgi:hypothetical protein